MIEVELLWHEYRYFPYERAFAVRELTALFGTSPQNESSTSLTITIPESDLDLLDRLTYFRKAKIGKRSSVPRQARLELSSRPTPKAGQEVVLRRQSTRYAAHGLHEYRGKFHPHVVRSIGNQIGLNPGSWILDPCCGSGTTLLEAIHNDWNSIGVDINPLAIQIATAKLWLARAPLKALGAALTDMRSHLESNFRGLNFEEAWTPATIKRLRYDLPYSEYLHAWFSDSVLVQLGQVSRELDTLSNKGIRNVFRVVMSDIAREVSLQEPADLRIRRRKDPAPNYPAISLFLERCEALLRSVEAARSATPSTKGSVAEVIHSDNRDGLASALQTLRTHGQERFDAAITSPPYATALPYIDTQRLSLCLLGLLSPAEVRTLERELTGSREFGGASDMARMEEAITARDGASFPESVWGLCQELLSAAQGPENGFRRKAVPGLVYRYFKDMSRLLSGVFDSLSSEGTFALVLGRNSSTLGGVQFVFDTPRLLADIAADQGWKVADSVELETFQRFDLHSQNSIRNENLLLLQRP